MRYILTLLLLASTTAFGQKLKPVSFYLAHPKVSKSAKDFYKKLPVYRKNTSLYYNDQKMETVTASIMDSVLTANNETRPFYLYLMNRNMDLADGALQLLVMIHQYKIFQSRPEAFFRYMRDNADEKKIYWDKWVNFMTLYSEQYCQNNPSAAAGDCMTGFRQKVTGMLLKNDVALAGLANDYFTAMNLPAGIPPRISIGSTENGRTIQCINGTVIEARFRECRGCASVWEIKKSEPEKIRLDKQDYINYSCVNCVGGSQDHIFYFTITGKGKTSLVFTYFDETVTVNFQVY